MKIECIKVLFVENQNSIILNKHLEQKETIHPNFKTCVFSHLKKQVTVDVGRLVTHQSQIMRPHSTFLQNDALKNATVF